ncbi:MAG: hypothetical protein NT080_09910 [Spirochaetes bacterium]|nr:hypothetical protein [Spirochaetota bacterium]
MLSEELRIFIETSQWTFAKTYAQTWPHEYIVREKSDHALFQALATHIDGQGYTEYFFQKAVIYLDHEGYSYWHMENIINRCVVRDTYHRREIDGRLPRL